MRRPKERKPVEWRQVCAIAKELLTADPSIPDSEWKERIKDRLFALDLTYPRQMELFPRAMDAVEKSLEKQWGPRPSQLSPPPCTRPEPIQRDPPWSGQRRQAGNWTSIQELLLHLVENTRRSRSSGRS